MDKRREKRISRIEPLYFISDEHGDYDFDYWAMTLNVSPSGLKIVTDRAVVSGQELELMCSQLWSASKNARVVWCNRLNNRMYKAGFLFDDPSNN